MSGLVIVPQPMREVCPRCGMKEPIFGDSCEICHAIPFHAAVLLKAFRERLTAVETKNEQIEHIYGIQLNAAESRANKAEQDTANLINKEMQALRMVSDVEAERDALKAKVAELEREIRKSTPQGQ